MSKPRKGIKCDGCSGEFPPHTHWCVHCIRKMLTPKQFKDWCNLQRKMEKIVQSSLSATK